MTALLTKTAHRRINARIITLRRERKSWLAGRYVPWGAPWCGGPASPYHQEPACEGCATVAWCRDEAGKLREQIDELEASLAPAVQEVLW